MNDYYDPKLDAALSEAKSTEQMIAIAAAYRPPLRSYLRLGNLMRFGAFWVVLGAILKLALA